MNNRRFTLPNISRPFSDLQNRNASSFQIPKSSYASSLDSISPPTTISKPSFLMKTATSLDNAYNNVSKKMGNVKDKIKNKMKPSEKTKQKFTSYTKYFFIILLIILISVIVVISILQFKSIVPSMYTSIQDVSLSLQTSNIDVLKASITSVTEKINKILADQSNDENALSNLKVTEAADIQQLTQTMTTTVTSLNNLIAQESNDVAAINSKYSDLNSQLTTLNTSLGALSMQENKDIQNIQTQITNIQNNMNLIPPSMNTTSTISGWNGPYLMNFSKASIPTDTATKSPISSNDADASINGACFDVSQNMNSATTNPTASSAGGLKACIMAEPNQMFYFNNNTGQLYNKGLDKCLTVGSGINPKASWTSCNTKDSTQKFNMSNNRLQYLDSAAFDISSSQSNMNTILSNSQSPNFPNQYVNFIYAGK